MAFGCEGVTAFGPLLSLIDRFACDGRSGKAGSGQASALRWSGRRCAPTALAQSLASAWACARRKTVRRDCLASGRTASVSWPRRRTRCIRFAHCAQTTATSQFLMRAARAATSPALLGAPQARCDLPEPLFADTAELFAGNTSHAGRRGRCCPGRATSVATSSAGPGSARAQRVPCNLTRRGCLNAVSAASGVSSAARPRTEQRSAVDAERRPSPQEPAPGCACRDTLTPCQSGPRLPPSTATRRQRPLPIHGQATPRESRQARGR